MWHHSHPQDMRGNVGSTALIRNGMAARWSTSGDPDSLLQFVDPDLFSRGAWDPTARERWGSTCMKNLPDPSEQTKKKKKKRGSSEMQYGAKYRGQCQFQRRFGSNADELVGADNKKVQCNTSFKKKETRTGYRAGKKILCGRCHHYFCFEHFTGHEVNTGAAPVTCDKTGYTLTHPQYPVPWCYPHVMPWYTCCPQMLRDNASSLTSPDSNSSPLSPLLRSPHTPCYLTHILHAGLREWVPAGVLAEGSNPRVQFSRPQI